MYIKKQDRDTPEYKEFREAVLKRDNHTCQMCGKRKKVYVHHIVPYAKSAYLRLNTFNGICLCYPCHKQVTGKEHQYVEQFTNRAFENAEKQLKRNS